VTFERVVVRAGLELPEHNGIRLFWGPGALRSAAEVLRSARLVALQRGASFVHPDSDAQAEVMPVVGRILETRIEEGAEGLQVKALARLCNPTGFLAHEVRRGAAGLSIRAEVLTMPGMREGRQVPVVVRVLPSQSQRIVDIVSHPAVEVSRREWESLQEARLARA